MTAPVLAQINIATARFDLDAPEMGSFFARVAAVNETGARSAGFVWRYESDPGASEELAVFGDPRLVVNMTVWESLEALADFIHRTIHAKVMARRADWFAPLDGPHLAMWWTDRARLPSLAEGKAKLDALAARGAGSDVFTFAQPFAADGAPLPAIGAAA